MGNSGGAQKTRADRNVYNDGVVEGLDRNEDFIENWTRGQPCSGMAKT